MSKYFNKGLIAIVSMIMLLPVSEVFAQSVIEEITVTARQREESLAGCSWNDYCTDC